MRIGFVRLLVLSVTALFVAAGVRPAAGAGVRLNVPSADYPTIQSALDAVPDGGTVVVAADEYHETLHLAGRANVTLSGKGVVVDADGADSVLWLDGCTAPVVTGFVFRDASKVGLLVEDCVGGTLSKCVVEDQQSDGIRLEGSDGVLVSACTVRNVGVDGISGLPGTVGTTVSKCVVEDAANHGIVIRGEEGAGAAPTTITGNTVARTARHGIATGGAHFLISKNRVSDTGWDGIAADSATVATSATVISGNTVTGGNRCISLAGADSQVLKNKVSGSDFGLFLTGTGILAAGNSVTAPGIGGVVLNPATGCRVEKTKVADSGGWGFHLAGGPNEIAGCSASSCANGGFLVEGTGSTLSGNKATDCGPYPGLDLSPVGANTWTGNKFEVVYVP